MIISNLLQSKNNLIAQLGPRRLVTIIGLIFAVCIAGLILNLSNLQKINQIWGSAIYPIFYIFTGWRCVQASNRGTANERKAWWFFAAACFSLSWAELVWGYYEIFMGINIPTPSVSDVGFLLFPLFVIMGFWFYYYKESNSKFTK